MISKQNSVRILFIYKHEEDKISPDIFPHTTYSIFKKNASTADMRYFSLYQQKKHQIVADLACDWEPDILVFSPKIRPGQIVQFASWLAEEPWPQKPFIISFFRLPKGTSRKLRKVYRVYISQFQKNTSVLDMTKFFRTPKKL